MTELNITELRATAQAALQSSGTWRLRSAEEKGWHQGDVGLYGKYGYLVRPSAHGGMFNDQAAAEHVATFDPAMVLALLDRLSEVESILDAELVQR